MNDSRCDSIEKILQHISEICLDEESYKHFSEGEECLLAAHIGSVELMNILLCNGYDWGSWRHITCPPKLAREMADYLLEKGCPWAWSFMCSQECLIRI